MVTIWFFKKREKNLKADKDIWQLRRVQTIRNSPSTNEPSKAGTGNRLGKVPWKAGPAVRRGAQLRTAHLRLSCSLLSTFSGSQDCRTKAKLLGVTLSPFPAGLLPTFPTESHPCALSTVSTHYSPNGLSLPCLEVAYNLVRKGVVPWSKLPHWHRWKQILPSNSFSTYKYIFVTKILHGEGDLMTQFACTPSYSEK